MMKTALTGASGFVGTALQNYFGPCVIIDRKDDEEAILNKLHNVDVVINLAGAPIIKRWDDPYKKILLNSRIESTERLVNAINRSDVSHFISTSAIGIYPDNQKCDESCTQIADDFLGHLANKWEDEAFLCNKPTAILRFGVILGKEGGALVQMLTPFSLGLGGIIGNGKMMTSWIDIEDLMRMYSFIMEHRLTGIFNATSPYPVNNYTFTKTLGNVLHRPTILPIPEFVLRIMYGEASSVLTGSKEVYPMAMQEKGFVFEYEEIEASLKHLLS
jgi:uncharacterized protein (TIGR01777 family)